MKTKVFELPKYKKIKAELIPIGESFWDVNGEEIEFINKIDKNKWTIEKSGKEEVCLDSDINKRYEVEVNYKFTADEIS